MADQPVTHLSAKQYTVQFIKFALFSISAGIIQILSFTALDLLTPVSYWPKYLIALTLSVVYNFTLNRQFTFKSTVNFPLAMMKVLGYYAVFTPLSTWWGDALTNRSWNEYLVLVGTMVINFITEFLFDRFVVFRNTINTNKSGQKEREKALMRSESAVSNAK